MTIKIININQRSLTAGRKVRWKLFTFYQSDEINQLDILSPDWNIAYKIITPRTTTSSPGM